MNGELWDQTNCNRERFAENVRFPGGRRFDSRRRYGMSRLLLELPTIQNWSCRNCGGCCRQHAIFITDEERRRIESQGWTAADGIPADQPLFREEKGSFGRTRTRLAHQPDGACVFLDDNGLCRIHGKFGEAAKPLACRIYPYAFHPLGAHVAVGLRFSCPSVARNLGRPVPSQKKELLDIAAAVVPANVGGFPPPPITPKTRLDWTGTSRIVAALDRLLSPDNVPIAWKLLRGLFVMDLVGQSRFEKIPGDRLEELLNLLCQGAEVEYSQRPTLGEPAAIARTQFRLLAGQYARKDTEATIDRSLSGRLRQLRLAWRLTTGRGTLPALQPELKDVPAATLEESFGPIPDESEEMLTRYYRVKVQSLHFCGAAYYGIPVVEGFQSLALTFPAIIWTARWHAWSHGRDRLIHDDVVWGLTAVDHQHGYSPAFGTWGFRRRVWTLSSTKNIEKLILAYS